MDDLVWGRFWADVTDRDWLTAKALLEVCAVVRRDAARWIEQGEYGLVARWDDWIASVDKHGRGWSSTENRLFDLVSSLLASEPRPVHLRDVLDSMGSWEPAVWRILVEWGSGGNNRDLPGRLTTAPRQ